VFQPWDKFNLFLYFIEGYVIIIFYKNFFLFGNDATAK
jgi:hypothetical protein